MAKQSIPSMELERSMNLMCHVMTIQEALRNSSIIDCLDDNRREEQHELQNYLLDLIKRFITTAKTLVSDEKLLIELNKLEINIQRYEKKYNYLLLQENNFEKIDDENRDYLIKYAEACREKLGDENSKIEAEIITKRVLK